MLFAASVLTYQVAAFVICLSILVYLSRAPRRRAVALWLSDICVVGMALGLPRLITGSAGATADPTISVVEQIHHARLMADQGLTLLAYVLVPFGGPHRNVVLPVVLVIVGAGAFAAFGGSDPVLRRDGRRWLATVLAGAVVVAAYAIYVPAPVALYQPLAKGAENRVNVMASFGYVLILYGLAMSVGSVMARLARAKSSWGVAGALVIVIAVFVGCVHRTHDDIVAWDRAGTVQRQELGKLRTAGGGRPASWTTIYAFGGIGATAPYVFAFRVTWDLNSAVQLLWNDATLHASLIFSGTEMTCTATQVVPVGPANGDGVDQAASYPQAVFYDFRSGRQQRIANASVCLRS